MHPWKSTNGDDDVISSSPPQPQPQPPPPFPSQTLLVTSAGGYNHQQQTSGNQILKNTTQNLPPLAASNSISLVPWSTGLCDCCDDHSTCCLTCWCPCIAFGRIAEIVDRGSTSCGVSGALYMLILSVTGGCGCLYSCFYRSKLRGQYFFMESPCSDCYIHCCCEACALCQEYRQLKHMGFDMSIGWHGNMERRKEGAREPPLVHSQMNR